MSTDVYANGVLTERWDDPTRTHTDYTTDPDTVRPYTAQENADADARDAQAADMAERAATEDRVASIIDDLQAEKDRVQVTIDTDNSVINDSPANYVKDNARAAKRIADAAIDLAKFVRGD
jgi:hypothetical protein